MDRRHNNIPSKHKHVRVVTANKHADICTNGITYVESLNTINGSVALATISEFHGVPYLPTTVNNSTGYYSTVAIINPKLHSTHTWTYRYMYCMFACKHMVHVHVMYLCTCTCTCTCVHVGQGVTGHSSPSAQPWLWSSFSSASSPCVSFAWRRPSSSELLPQTAQYADQSITMVTRQDFIHLLLFLCVWVIILFGIRFVYPVCIVSFLLVFFFLVLGGVWFVLSLHAALVIPTWLFTYVTFIYMYRTSSKNSSLLIIRHPSAESGQITSIIRRGVPKKVQNLVSISAYFRHFALHVDDVVELAVYRERDECDQWWFFDPQASKADGLHPWGAGEWRATSVP